MRVGVCVDKSEELISRFIIIMTSPRVIDGSDGWSDLKLDEIEQGIDPYIKKKKRLNVQYS